MTAEEAAAAQIKDIGFVFAAGSNVPHPHMDDVKAIVENGETIDGYTVISLGESLFRNTYEEKVINPAPFCGGNGFSIK